MAILGESFKPYVRNQINIRQDKLSLDQTRDNDVLKYITSKTSFLRLTSGVDIDEKVAQNLGVIGFEGSALAKQYVLEAARFKPTPESNPNFTSNVGYSLGTFNASYGFNSDPNYGLVPPPGLTSATINTLNRGTIREATINLVCHNLYQFKIINTLFLKLKYSLLLEWGHTLYFNNENTLVTPIEAGALNLSNDFLSGMSSDKILDKIENNRSGSNGNYDAFFGVVKNFNWELQENGSYNVTINAISQGSVIESLKVNSNLTPNINVGGNEPQFQKSTLHKILGDIITKIADGPDGPGGTYQGFLHGYKTKDNEIALNTTNISNFTGVTSNYRHPLDTDSTTSGANSIITHNEGLAITFPGLKANKDGEPAPQFYIKLGTLLRIIESFTLYYDLSKKTENGTPPSIFYIDHDFDKNECVTIPRQISVDPFTCVIPVDFTNSSELNQTVSSTYNLTTTTYTIVTDAAGAIISTTSNVLPTQTNLFENPNKAISEDKQSAETVVGTSVTFSNGFTDTLTKVILNQDSIQDALLKIEQNASSLTGVNITITTQTITKSTFYTVNNESQAGTLSYVEKGFRTENQFIGKTMHMYININKIIEILDRNIDDDGNVSVHTFLTQLLSSLKYALGSINNFDLNYDATTNRFSIIDSAVIPFKYQSLNKDNISKFNINLLKDKENGGGSFITNFSLKSEVFSRIANAIAIGAQNNGNAMIANSTPLSNFNEGLTDRSITIKQNSNLNNSKTNQGFDQFSAAYKAYEVYKRKVTSTVPEEGLNASDIDLYRNFLVDLFNYDLGTYTNNGHIPGTGFIPLNLQLTMDGLSGIIQYQTFNIDETLLPTEYQNRLGFITTTVAHKVDTKGWETTIGSLAVPKLYKTKTNITTTPVPEVKKEPKNTTVDVTGGDKCEKLNSSQLSVAQSIVAEAKKRGINDKNRLTCLLTVAYAESRFKLGTSEKFNYNANKIGTGTSSKWNGDASVIFKDKLSKAGIDKERLKTVLSNPNDSLANYVYANRGGNGGPSTGDGYKYRGRGVTQTTFKSGYESTQNSLNKYGIQTNLVANPDNIFQYEIPVLVIGKIEGLYGKKLSESTNYINSADSIAQTQNGGKNRASDNYRDALSCINSNPSIQNLIV